ncbi:MAG: hypothetical protein HOB34_08270 [Nitrospina sp.]|jgi:hypothetical protein|nr:hypothetical protein [Nitrospina sp.]
MVVSTFSLQKVFPYSVSVNVLGGKETGAMDKSQISNEAFMQAIADSLYKSGLFSEIIHGKNADYLLNVMIFDLTQPSFGLSFTVKMEAVWSLAHADSKKVIMRESIRSSFTATMGEAFAAVTRLRLATEGAAQENIRLGIKKLSQLNLQ